MCADEYLTVSFDIRTGRVSIKDTGGLSASGKSRMYAALSDATNDAPQRIFEFIIRSRFNVCP